MTDNKYDIDRLIAYFEMAVKVMGWKNPEQDSYEFHAAKMLKQLREERDEARRLYLASNFDEDEIIAEMRRNKWDCFKEESN
jgi:hypothetical protein